MADFEKSYRNSSNLLIRKWEEAQRQVRAQTLDLIRVTSENLAIIESIKSQDEKLPDSVLAILRRKRGEE